MNAAEHKAKAESLLLELTNECHPERRRPEVIAEAQVHATLATIPDTAPAPGEGICGVICKFLLTHGGERIVGACVLPLGHKSEWHEYPQADGLEPLRWQDPEPR